MIAADTNVWARAYLNDDIEQATRARKAIAAGCASGGVYVPLIVLAELYWVLRSQWTKERVLNTLEHLLETEGVVVESSSIAAKAIREARVGAAGLADILIAEASFAAGAEQVITFDKGLGRRAKVRRLS